MTIDNIVKYIPQSEKTQSISRDFNPNSIKNISLPNKQSTKFSQNNQKPNKDYTTGEGFDILE